MSFLEMLGQIFESHPEDEIRYVPGPDGSKIPAGPAVQEPGTPSLANQRPTDYAPALVRDPTSVRQPQVHDYVPRMPVHPATNPDHESALNIRSGTSTDEFDREGPEYEPMRRVVQPTIEPIPVTIVDPDEGAGGWQSAGSRVYAVAANAEVQLGGFDPRRRRITVRNEDGSNGVRIYFERQAARQGFLLPAGADQDVYTQDDVFVALDPYGTNTTTVQVSIVIEFGKGQL